MCQRVLIFNYKVSNGTIPYKKETSGDYNIHNWKLINANELPKSEYYMPMYPDYARVLHISTIGSWNDIANWYSDLVRSQLTLNAEAEEMFNKVFPEEDPNTLSDEVKAKRIYDFIADNFTYSYVSFKQSGFIPQKPSKTISSKLGDCKDFSTLFTAFSRKVGLKSNLVLVSTSDLGEKNLILPSQNFNHCIVKVNMSDKDYFIELTDKNLPFNSTPNSLLNAIGLEIPYEVSEDKKQEIFLIKDTNSTESVSKKEIDVLVKDDALSFNVDAQIKGSLASYYFEVLSKDKYEDIKEELKIDIKNRVGEAVVIDSVYDMSIDKKAGQASYKVSLKMANRINKLGSMKIFELPFFSNAYNKDIITEEVRKYPIQYTFYENNDVYKTTYNITLPEGRRFVEIPESKEYTYKKHTYKITFTSKSDSQLKINIDARPDKTNISVQEYKEFKRYIKNVLKTKDLMLGFK